MKVAYVQFEPVYLERDTNLSALGRLLDGVSAELIVLPELCTSGYFFRNDDDVQRAAEPVPDGPTTRWMVERARVTDSILVAGVAETDNGKQYNSAVVVGREGLIGRYRKVHLFYEEKRWFEPGNLGFPVFTAQESGVGESFGLGVMICFDWYYPEAARSLMLGGAEVIAHPSNLVKKWCPDAMPFRALENGVFTITANRTGTESNGREELSFIGRSTICAPSGEVLAASGRNEAEVVEVEIDVSEARTKSVTSMNELLGDRRPDTYRI